MGMIQNDWLEEISVELEAILCLSCSICEKEYSTYVVYPAEDIFNAFLFLPPSKVKVIFWGSDLS